MVVEKTSEEGSHDDFIADLPESECRWAVYDFIVDSEEGNRNNLVFISWCVFLLSRPSLNSSGFKWRVALIASGLGRRIRRKSSRRCFLHRQRDTLRKSLSGIVTDISATDDDDVSYETSMFLLISQ